MTKKESVLKFFLCAVCASALVFSVVKPAEAAGAAFAALSLCARRVVPGVFLFMAAARMFAKCGAARAFSRITHGLLEKLFGLSECGAATVFLGMLSGYPSGACVAAEYMKNGTLSIKEAERILPFATAASPAFLVASVGAMCGGARYGVIMLFAQLASAFLLLFLTRGGAKTAVYEKTEQKTSSPLSAFTASIKECGAAVLNICSFVTFFYVFSAMIFSILPTEWKCGFPCALLAGACEISCGFSRLGALEHGCLHYFCGGLMLGFSGFSVFLQSADAVGDFGVSMKKYLFLKALQAFVCAFFAAIFGTIADIFGSVDAFVSFGAEQRRVAAIWEICVLFLVFCSVLAFLLIFIAKIFTFFKKIFKKLWKKNNL